MLNYLNKSVKQLENSGADFIVMPCNTLHSLVPYLRKSTKLEFIDLIEEVSKKIRNFRKIGVLCTTKTKNDKLYDDALQGVEIIYPSKKEQGEISKIILRIISGMVVNGDGEYLEKIIDILRKKGAEKVLLACTDLTHLIKSDNYVLDSTEILIDVVSERMKKDTF